MAAKVKKSWPACKNGDYRGLVRPASTPTIRDLAFDTSVLPRKRTILKQELRHRGAL